MKRQNRSAFTLIELLVVVAIIALLIAILLPALGRAKANAVRIKCAAVLKQWGMVITMYAQENSDIFGIQWKDSTDTHAWTSISTGSVTEMYDSEWATRGMSSGFKYSAGLHSCPGDPLFGLILNTTNQASNNNRPPVDYTMVRYIPQVSGVLQWKMGTFNHPSTTLLMCDSAPKTENFYISTMGDLDQTTPSLLPPALQQRHGGLGNAMFLDCHVEAHPYQDFVNNITTSTSTSSANYSRAWTYQNLP